MSSKIRAYILRLALQQSEAVLSSRHLRFEAVYTHFATADQPDTPFLETQRTRFDAPARCRHRIFCMANAIQIADIRSFPWPQPAE